jgi:hypothetical protein
MMLILNSMSLSFLNSMKILNCLMNSELELLALLLELSDALEDDSLDSELELELTAA